MRLQCQNFQVSVHVFDLRKHLKFEGANTNATCIALGEKGAHIIIEQYT